MVFSRKQFLQKSGLAALSGVGMLEILNVREGVHHSKKIKPKALKNGDTLGLVAPGSPIYEEEVFERMLTDLRNLGFELKLAEHVRSQRGYLAGSDQNRADDLMAMFQDPDVDGIMCIRGGWGSNRILPLLDYDVIAANPKVFCGFSDITSLHMALYKKSHLITFHGPVGKSIWTPFTRKAFVKVLMDGEAPEYTLLDKPGNAFTLNPGKTRGKLFGGNLSVMSSMIGSGYIPDLKGAILFLEDIGEKVYRIDRMLTQLKLAGILDKLSGFIFGKCTACAAGANSLTMQEMLNDHLDPLQIPAFYGAYISHEEDNITLPVGMEAEMDATQKTIRILEPSVV